MRWLAALLLVGSTSACNGSSRAAAASEETASGTPTKTTPAGPAEITSSQSSQVRRATLTIDGMVCQGCAEAAKQTLSRIDGVVSAETDFQARAATVAFDSSKTNVDALAAAIEGVDRDPAPAFRVTARTERQ